VDWTCVVQLFIAIHLRGLRSPMCREFRNRRFGRFMAVVNRMML
jgi:hypothetical protein